MFLKTHLYTHTHNATTKRVRRYSPHSIMQCYMAASKLVRDCNMDLLHCYELSQSAQYHTEPTVVSYSCTVGKRLVRPNKPEKWTIQCLITSTEWLNPEAFQTERAAERDCWKQFKTAITHCSQKEQQKKGAEKTKTGNILTTICLARPRPTRRRKCSINDTVSLRTNLDSESTVINTTWAESPLDEYRSSPHWEAVK